MIKPTVGRIVLFHAGGKHEQTNAAIIAAVIDDNTVNLAAFDEFGSLYPQIGILLVQDGAKPPHAGSAWCEWMPYQKGQAAKTEQAEAALKAKSEQAAGDPAAV